MNKNMKNLLIAAVVIGIGYYAWKKYSDKKKVEEMKKAELAKTSAAPTGAQGTFIARQAPNTEEVVVATDKVMQADNISSAQTAVI